MDERADGQSQVEEARQGDECLRDEQLWTCKPVTWDNYCGFACGLYTVTCAGNTCSCALAEEDGVPCDPSLIEGTASCEPDSTCLQAVSSGCCDRL